MATAGGLRSMDSSVHNLVSRHNLTRLVGRGASIPDALRCCQRTAPDGTAHGRNGSYRSLQLILTCARILRLQRYDADWPITRDPITYGVSREVAQARRPLFPKPPHVRYG